MYLNFLRVSEILDTILSISYRNYVIFGFLAIRFGSKKSNFGSVLKIIFYYFNIRELIN